MCVCCCISTRFVLLGGFKLDQEFGGIPEYVENNGQVSVTVWAIRHRYVYCDASCKVSEQPRNVSHGYLQDYVVLTSR